MRSPDGQVGVGTARTSSARGGRRGARAARPPPPPARRRARRAPAPGRCARAARARRGRRGRRAARAPCAPGPAVAPARPHHLRPAVGVELGDHPRVRERDADDRRRQRLERDQHDRGGDERDAVGRGRRASTARRGARRRAASSGGAPGDAARALGQRARRRASTQPPAIGRRRITRSASSGQLADLLGLPLARAHDGVVAGVELARGTPRRRPRRTRRRRGRPLGERRVAGAVHADESCHARAPFRRSGSVPVNGTPSAVAVLRSAWALAPGARPLPGLATSSPMSNPLDSSGALLCPLRVPPSPRTARAQLRGPLGRRRARVRARRLAGPGGRSAAPGSALRRDAAPGHGGAGAARWPGCSRRRRGCRSSEEEIRAHFTPLVPRPARRLARRHQPVAGLRARPRRAPGYVGVSVDQPRRHRRSSIAGRGGRPLTLTFVVGRSRGSSRTPTLCSSTPLRPPRSPCRRSTSDPAAVGTDTCSSSTAPARAGARC